jgi:tRNA(Arg) A34 adenosine deaminase TadA
MSKFSNYYSRTVRDAYESYSYLEDSISNTDVSFLSATAKIATTSQYRFRIAAMIVKSGRVLGADVNQHKVTVSTPPNRVSTHAEVRVIKNTRNTEGATLYVARLRSQDIPALARPCGWCMQHILNAGINRVVFTTNNQIGSSFYTDMITWKEDFHDH